MVKAYEGALILAEVCLVVLKIIYATLEAAYRLIVPPEEKNVAGEIVLVTGAGHGIGREIAMKYASLGSTVICVDLNPQGNQETINDIKKLGATAVHGYECDVSNREQVMKVAARIKAEVGDVSILVNNAGIMPCHPFLETTPEEITRIFGINVFAHCWTLQAFLPRMVEKNHGHIVTLSSIAGMIGLENLVPYCGSKFAVRGMMEALYMELRGPRADGQPNNVTGTVVYPYMVDTGLCHTAKIRFPSILSMVTPKQAAAHIISAQRRNLLETSIPSYWLAVNSFIRNFPITVGLHLKDFLKSGVESDLL